MGKVRFVNESVLVASLPIFLPMAVTSGPNPEASLDRVIDFVEEELILEKAAEIQVRREQLKNSKLADALASSVEDCCGAGCHTCDEIIESSPRPRPGPKP